MVKRVIASLAIILLLFTSSDMALFPVMVTAIAATEENAVNSHNGVNNTNYSYIDERHPEDDFSDADEHEAGQEDDFIHENEVKEDEDKESTDNETLVIEDDTISHEDVLTDDIADISMLNIANTINGDVTISTHTTISQDTLFTGNVTIDANVTIE
ncbi:MAG: hypothetical protein LBC96_01065, partial [Lachnospiraceae bacterium]|nr:hypothetical protein [Lachnospiraceae bacterium]